MDKRKDTFHEIGGYGKYQRYMTLIILFIGSSSSVVVMQTIFTCHEPFHECIEFTSNLTYNTSDDCDIENIMSICKTWKYDQSVVESSIVTEFNLVCQKSKLAKLAKTVMMSGAIPGVMIAFLGDTFGRKKVIMTACIIILVGKIVSAFSTNLWVYILFRFILKAFDSCIYTVAFVLASELVSTDFTVWVGVLSSCVYASVITVVPALAYFIRIRKYFESSFIIFDIFNICLMWLIPESPKWQITRNKNDEAILTYQKIAKTNGKILSDEIIEDLLISKDEPMQRESLFLISKHIGLLLQSGVLCMYWFAASFVYYGLTLNIGELAGNIFLNTLINCLVEIPAQIFVFLSLRHFGRKFSLMFFMIISAIILLSSIAVPAEKAFIGNIMGQLGKFTITMAFTSVYIYTGEFFPTSIRASGLGIAACFARLASVAAPFATEVSKSDNKIGMISYGILASISGLAIIILPETKGRPIPQKISDHHKTRFVTLQSTNIDEKCLPLNRYVLPTN